MKITHALMGTLLALAAVAAGPAEARQRVKRCDAIAEQELVAARGIVNANLATLTQRLDFLTADERARFAGRWDKVKMACADDRLLCENNAGLLGFAHGGPGNTVRVCYYNMVALNQSLCELVGVVVHEKGHADGMPKLSNHNQLTNLADQQRDPVYQMGFAAEDVCRQALGSGDRPLRGAAELDLGDACEKDAQCSSDKCEFGVCTCKRDADCGAGGRCRRRLGKNTCE